MMKTLLFFLLIPLMLSRSISASLKVMQYEPLQFSLIFSEKASLPSFQLILNNVHVLNYTIISSETLSQAFIFQTDSYPLPDSQVLEKFEVLFNQPFAIGSGRLPIDYFRLSAQKDGIQIQQPEVWAYLIIIAGYLFVNFGFFGMILIEFLQVYCLLNFRTNNHTQTYHAVSKAFFMLNPNLSESSNQLVMAQLCVPPLVIFLLGLVGLLVKRCMKERRTIAKRVTYEIFVYDSFVCASLTFILPCFYNSIQFLKQSSLGYYRNNTTLTGMGTFLSYVGIITPIALIYLFFYQLNPKCRESHQSWKKYTQGQQFQSFRRLHSILKKQKWFARNKILFMTLKLTTIAALSFLPLGFEISVFLLEFMNIFFSFMIQPYKEEIYMNIVGVCRLLMLSYYGVRVMGSLYYAMSPALINYSTMKPYLIGCDVVFLLVCLCLIIAISYEIYIKFSHLNYQIKLVREKNELKLKFIERRPTEPVSQKGKKNEKTDYEMSEAYEERLKKDVLSSEGRKRDQSSQRRLTKLNQFSLPRKKQIMMDEQGLELSFPDKKQQLRQSKVRSNSKTIISFEQQEAKTRRQKIKWKKQSLLASILKEQ